MERNIPNSVRFTVILDGVKYSGYREFSSDESGMWEWYSDRAIDTTLEEVRKSREGIDVYSG